jgi:hypothetical protein
MSFSFPKEKRPAANQAPGAMRVSGFLSYNSALFAVFS